MSAITSVPLPVINIDSKIESKANNSNLDQCYVNQDNTISFLNNTNTFTDENGEMFYACITSSGDATQEQVLQLIPQNQLSNFVITDKDYPEVRFVNQNALFSGNQFFNNMPSDSPFKLPNKQYCGICSIDFPSKRTFLKHMSVHENDREFKCGWCKMSYNYEINLLVHIAIIHPNQCSLEDESDVNMKYHCLVCSLSFSREKALQGHCLIHQVDEELLCDQCSTQFKSRVLLDKHVSEHYMDELKPVMASGLRCKICQQTCENAGHIKQHYKLYHPKIDVWDENLSKEKDLLYIPKTNNEQNVDPSKKRRSSKIASETIKLYAQGKLKLRESSPEFKEGKRRGRPKKPESSTKKTANTDVTCSTCQRIFKTAILLRRHEVTHSGVKEFECHICKKRFTQKSSVKIHMVVHETEKAYNCKMCHKVFTYEHNMKTHIKTVHRSNGEKKTNANKIFRANSANHKVVRRMTQIKNRKYGNRDKYNVNNSYFDDVNNLGAYDNNNTQNYSATYVVSDEFPHDAADLFPKSEKDLNDGLYLSSVTNDAHCEDRDLSQYIWQNAHSVAYNEVVVSSSHQNRSSKNVYVPSTQNFTKIDWDKSQPFTEHRGILLSENVEKIDKETGQMQCYEVIRDQITGFKRFRCHFCKKLYQKSCDLLRHIRIHNHQRPFKCYICRKEFRLKSVLKNHFKSHWKLKEFSCDICLKSFNLRQTLKVHSRLHNPSEMKYSCTDCDIKFNSLFHYKYHLRSQHRNPLMTKLGYVDSDGDREVKPLILDKSIVEVRKPVVDRPFKCHQCNKSYKLRKYLREHVKDHNTGSRLLCNYCHKSFLTLRSLQQHLRTQHINRRNFPCSQCPATFILKASLIRHGLVHSTSKPYACPVCFRRFKAKIYADRHIGLQNCSKSTKYSLNQSDLDNVHNEINKLGSNIESEILTTEQAGNYCNFQLIDLDLNTSQNSNILVANYVNEFSAFSNSDKFMVVSLDNSKLTNQHQNELTAQNSYYGSNIIMEDSLVEMGRSQGETCVDTHDNMIGMLESQLGVSAADIGAIYNYSGDLATQLVDTGGYGNQQQQQQQHHDNSSSSNVFYYQTVADIEEPAKGSLADKFPLLKASLFSNDEPKPLPIKSMLYCQDKADQFLSNYGGVQSGKLYHGCANCSAQFVGSESLIAHVRAHHKLLKEFVCNVCHKAFSVNLSLWAHSKIHDTAHTDATRPRHHQLDDFLACIACDQKFISVPSLSRHVRMQHNDKLNLYRCTHCDRCYKTTRELESHIKQLNSDFDAIIVNSQLHSQSAGTESKSAREVKDPNCSTDFLVELHDSDIEQIASLEVDKTSKLSMQELIRAAQDRRGLGPAQSRSDKCQLDPLLTFAYSCSVCHKGFSRASNLQQHLSVHTKQTPYACTKCNRKFRHRCSLQTHENTKHSGLMKLLRCHLCLRLVRSQVALRNHMRVHLKSYSFRCAKCGHSFATYQERVRHYKLCQCHETCAESVVDIDSYKAEKADELTTTTTTAAAAVTAVTTTSTMQVTCVTCGTAFHSTGEYENHGCITQKRSSHQCVLCQHTFLSSTDLCSHIADVHSQHQKYTCATCNLLFIQESLLISHQRSVHNI